MSEAATVEAPEAEVTIQPRTKAAAATPYLEVDGAEPSKDGSTTTTTSQSITDTTVLDGVPTITTTDTIEQDQNQSTTTTTTQSITVNDTPPSVTTEHEGDEGSVPGTPPSSCHAAS